MSARRSRSGAICDVEYLQPVEQVLAERAALDGFAQVAVARGDDADIRLQHPGAAEPLELAFLQDAQELRLRREAHLADLVEEQHAAGRQLDLARLGLLRAGERAALVAEQLRLEQLLRQRGAVQRDERSLASRRHAVDEPRDHFLARAGLAGHQHGRIGLRDVGRLVQHLEPFGRLSDDRACRSS